MVKRVLIGMLAVALSLTLLSCATADGRGGMVSDDTAQSVGQFLGAELVITGQLWDLGAVRRLTANAILVETAMRPASRALTCATITLCKA